MRSISPIQQKILDFISERLDMGEAVPTVREICDAVGLKSTSSVHANLNSLEKNGYIRRDPMRKRAITVVGRAKNIRSVPLLGVVTAGQPILAVEQIEDYLPFTGNVSRDKTLFALRVRGDSMINAGIYSGDIIFAEQTPTAENGEIVVAMIDDEATVKRFYKENGGYRLQPENDTMQPIYANEVSVLGKVVGLYRSY